MAAKQISYRFVMAVKSMPSKAFIFSNDYDEKLSPDAVSKMAKEYCEKTMHVKLICKKTERLKSHK